MSLENKSVSLQGTLSGSKYQHSLPKRTVDPLLHVVRSVRSARQICMYARAWKCFYLLWNSRTSISNYPWQLQYLLKTMQEMVGWLGMTIPSWRINEFENICFLEILKYTLWLT